MSEADTGSEGFYEVSQDRHRSAPAPIWASDNNVFSDDFISHLDPVFTSAIRLEGAGFICDWDKHKHIRIKPKHSYLLWNENF